MKRIRSAITIFCFLFFGVGAVIVNFLLFPFIKNNKKLCSDIIFHLWKFFTNFLIFIKLIKLNVKKLEKIENKVIVSTHPSFIDIVILMGMIPRTTCFVKQSLAKNPILKNIISSIFITNDVELEELKKQTKNMLDLGFNLIIFPAGTRHRKNEYPKIKKGAALIALNANKNIVPVKIFSDEDFLFIHQPFYAAGDKTVTFEIEQCEEIDLGMYQDKSEISAKKQITKQIEKTLYSL